MAELERRIKSKILFFSLVIMGILLMFTNSCNRNGGTITDIDGNVYRTVTIGTQIWMAENLKTTKYRNGDPIPNDKTSWSRNFTIGACCDYNNDANNSAIYGRLYNWYAVNDSRNIAPKGWHVPTIYEWRTLIAFLGAESGRKLKETGTAHWQSNWQVPNNGTNEKGFTALPSGYRDFDGDDIQIGYQCCWWSSSATESTRALDIDLQNNLSDFVSFDYTKNLGFSVRCVKDN